MPRKRRLDQGPPVPRCRNACQRCKEKRFKCSDNTRPCVRCVEDQTTCVFAASHIRGRKKRQAHLLDSRVVRFSSSEEESRVEFEESSSESPRQHHDTLDADDMSMQYLGDLVLVSDASQEIMPAMTGLQWTPLTPLRSNLLSSSPQLRMLWHHYIDTLACLHSSHDKLSNPIISVLGPVAQSSESLLAVLLASSLENFRSLRGEKPDQEMLTSLLNTAINGIQKEMIESQDGCVSDQCLAAVIALCDFEVVARKRATTSSWRVHLEGARKIIQLRGGPHANSSANPQLWQFLLKWLAFFDIMSCITPTSQSVEPLFKGVYWRASQGSDQDEDEFRLDPYMSFLQDVMPMFFEIGALTQQKRRLNERKNVDLKEASTLLQTCKDLEDKLRKTLGKVSGQPYIQPNKLSILLNCHDAFVQASLIHLYRRVEGLSSYAEPVRRAVAEGLCNIASSCQLNGEDFIDASLLFPLFTLGCETFTQRERKYLLDRLCGLQALGLGNVDRAIEVLHKIWSKTYLEDESPDWDEILTMFDWEVNLA